MRLKGSKNKLSKSESIKLAAQELAQKSVGVTDLFGNSASTEDFYSKGQSIRTILNAPELVKLGLKGWPSICNTRNASILSTIPLHLYYNKKSNKKLEFTPYCNISRFKSAYIKDSIRNIIIKQAEEIVEIIEHPFLDLLNNVNESMNYIDWMQLEQMYLGLIGNSYTLINKNGENTTLEPLLSEYVNPLTQKDKSKVSGEIIGYSYKIPGQKEQIYKAEDIIHFVNYAPGNLLNGNGDLETCIMAAKRLQYYDLYEMYLNANNARPDHVWLRKERSTEKDLKEMYRQIDKRFRGVANSGKPLVVSGGDVDIKTLGFAPKDMAYNNGRESSIQEIAAAFGLPESLLKLNDANYASAKVGMTQYYRTTILPKLVKFVEKLNEQLLPSYDNSGNLFIYFEEPKIIDPTENANIVISAFEKGILDRNEVRLALGYETQDKTQDEVTDEPAKV
jgi:HK97 family phage portal protein